MWIVNPCIFSSSAIDWYHRNELFTCLLLQSAYPCFIKKYLTINTVWYAGYNCVCVCVCVCARACVRARVCVSDWKIDGLPQLRSVCFDILLAMCVSH